MFWGGLNFTCFVSVSGYLPVSVSDSVFWHFLYTTARLKYYDRILFVSK